MSEGILALPQITGRTTKRLLGIQSLFIRGADGTSDEFMEQRGIAGI
jgi:hypothetical protein